LNKDAPFHRSIERLGCGWSFEEAQGTAKDIATLNEREFNLSHLFRREVFAHDMALNSAPIPPLLKEDTATLAFSASKDGKLRVTYAG
jgi:hypothetical protein